MYLEGFPFKSGLVGVLGVLDASCTCMSICFFRVRKFYSIILLKIISMSLLWHSSLSMSVISKLGLFHVFQNSLKFCLCLTFFFSFTGDLIPLLYISSLTLF